MTTNLSNQRSTKVTPFFEKGRKEDPGNYSLISAWVNNATNPPGSNVKIHARQGDDLR